MKDVVLNEVMKELSWRERLVVKILRKGFIKALNIYRIKIVNKILEQ